MCIAVLKKRDEIEALFFAMPNQRKMFCRMRHIFNYYHMLIIITAVALHWKLLSLIEHIKWLVVKSKLNQVEARKI